MYKDTERIQDWKTLIKINQRHILYSFILSFIIFKIVKSKYYFRDFAESMTYFSYKLKSKLINKQLQLVTSTKLGTIISYYLMSLPCLGCWPLITSFLAIGLMLLLVLKFPLIFNLVFKFGFNVCFNTKINLIFEIFFFFLNLILKFNLNFQFDTIFFFWNYEWYESNNEIKIFIK